MRRTTSAPPRAGHTSRRSGNWPSPPRSAHTASLRLRPGEEGRGFFQELVLHPQPAYLVFQFFHVCALHRRQRLIGLRVRTPPHVHPIPQGAVMDSEVTGNLGDRTAGLQHHLHRLSLELRAEPATTFWHEPHPLEIKRTCPRSLVHPKTIREIKCLAQGADQGRGKVVT